MTGPAPAPLMHRAAQDLPWVATGEGASIRVPHADPAAGVFVLNSRLEPGYRSGRHRHTGEVFVITLSGAWTYLEHPDVNRAGSYLYEAADSIHTLKVPDDAQGETEFWAIVHGALDYVDDDGQVVASLDARGAARMYRDACAKAGLAAPAILG